VDLRGLRVMVTGGSGFIGSHLIDELLARGNRVVVYDNFDPFYLGKEKNIESHVGDPNFTLVRANILDRKTLSSAMEGADIVFHEAAQPGVRYSIENPQKVHDVNVTGALNVLRTASIHDVKRVVFASSSSVYGLPEYLPFDEEHPTKPNSPYAASKLCAEKYCQVFHSIYGLDVVVLRYFSVYGPRQRPDQVIRIFVHNVLVGKPVRIYGDGEQTRDFTYVDDAVEATLLAAEVDEADGMVINVGSGRRISINGLIEEISRSMGIEGETDHVHEEASPGDFPHTLADVSLARRVLGYEPRLDLREGLGEFIEWLRKENV
jgi:UDP-glucose 4-epimerase